MASYSVTNGEVGNNRNLGGAPSDGRITRQDDDESQGYTYPYWYNPEIKKRTMRMVLRMGSVRWVPIKPRRKRVERTTVTPANTIVSTGGFSLLRGSNAGETFVVVPCATCWDEIRVEFPKFQEMILTADDGKSSPLSHRYCAFCSRIEDEGLEKNEVYAIRCYEHGLYAGSALRYQHPRAKARIARESARLLYFVDRVWSYEVQNHVRLQQASANEREEAKCIFYENFKSGFMDSGWSLEYVNPRYF
ncbi:MAG: hypothetical protein M3441_11110 [Chloroflexota bacterium]|nr:hypothetical protein [Chloroflexota bacterium]